MPSRDPVSQKYHEDTISVIRTADWLLTASWDGTAVVMDKQSYQPKMKATFNGPVLAAAWSHADPDKFYAGGTEDRVAEVDVITGEIYGVGAPFESPVLGIGTSTHGQVVAASARQLQVIDPRKDTKYTVPMSEEDRIIAMDSAADIVVLVLDNQRVAVYDIRRMSDPLFIHNYSYESPAPLTCIRMAADASAFAVGTATSRVIVEQTQSEAHRDNIVFRANRTSGPDGQRVAHYIGALAFQPNSGNKVLASAGTDKRVQLWNLQVQSKLGEIDGLVNAVTAMDWVDSSTLAIGCSDMSYLRTANTAKQPSPSSLLIQDVSEFFTRE